MVEGSCVTVGRRCGGVRASALMSWQDVGNKKAGGGRKQ